MAAPVAQSALREIARTRSWKSHHRRDGDRLAGSAAEPPRRGSTRGTRSRDEDAQRDSRPENGDGHGNRTTRQGQRNPPGSSGTPTVAGLGSDGPLLALSNATQGCNDRIDAHCARFVRVRLWDIWGGLAGLWSGWRCSASCWRGAVARCSRRRQCLHQLRCPLRRLRRGCPRHQFRPPQLRRRSPGARPQPPVRPTARWVCRS